MMNNNMGNLGQGFSVDQLPQDDSFDTIPAGWYNAKITESELRDTRAGTGQYIQVRFDITGPQQAGRVMFDNLNIRNPSEVAERIGLQQLNSLLTACGLSSITDTSQLIGHDVQIQVSRTEDSSQYADVNGFRNDVKAYRAVGGGSAAPMPQQQQAQQMQQSPQQMQQQAAQPAPQQTPPWQQ